MRSPRRARMLLRPFRPESPKTRGAANGRRPALLQGLVFRWRNEERRVERTPPLVCPGLEIGPFCGERSHEAELGAPPRTGGRAV